MTENGSSEKQRIKVQGRLKKMLRLWRFQSACRIPGWRAPADSWKNRRAWQIVDLSYRDDSSRAFLKSLNCGLTGIMVFLRGKELWTVQLWRTNHQGGRERVGGSWEGVTCWSVHLTSQARQQQVRSLCQSFLGSSWRCGFFLPLCPATSLPLPLFLFLAPPQGRLWGGQRPAVAFSSHCTGRLGRKGWWSRKS